MQRSRRSLLSSLPSGLLFVGTGCLADTDEEPGQSERDHGSTSNGTHGERTGTRSDERSTRPDVDCEDARRPTATISEDAGGDVESPPPYPEGPPPVADLDAAVDYAVAFERAYRHNEELTGQSTLTDFDIWDVETRTFDAPPEAVVCRLRYDCSTEYGAGETVAVGDGTSHATYYLDASVVVRAAGRGRGSEDELEPDPWADGRAVACFDSTTS